ncbi:amino acid ABC transporter substrate-binding protein [Alcaligenaceae bacterium]|nr:amino acid ABC transporter substrate-binding protein [Alcaligenaceae bacterium]
MKNKNDKQVKTRAVGLGALLISLCSLGAFSASAAAAGNYGNCEVTGERGSITLLTVVPGALSVRPVLPSPGWWNGDSPDTIKDGFEYCMAATMAHRAGLDKVNVVTRSFAQILTGQSQGFDIALSEITITPERQKVVDFTVPYFHSDQGIMVKKGAKVTQDNVKAMRIGVKQGTTMHDYVTEKIKPEQPIKVYTEVSSMYAALAAGQVDLVIYDAPNVLAGAKQSNGLFEVIGRYETGESWGGLVNKDSPNLNAFNTLIDAMKADGTFDKLAKTYLVPSFGADPATLPIFTP